MLRSPARPMGFFESVFAFGFGRGSPNWDLEHRRARAVGMLLRASGGAVYAEQVAPFSDDYLLAGGTAGDRLADTLKLFSIAASMGSPESLIIPPGLLGPRELPPALEAASGIAAGTVRLAMGLDDPEDLIADLAEALESIRA